MVLFDSAYLKIEFRNVPCRHLAISWLGLPLTDIFHEGVNTILRCCEENDVRKLLTDIRYQEQLPEADERFAEEAINKHGARYGMIYNAIVLSNEVFVRFDSRYLESQNNQTYQVKQFFGNEREATAWLHEIDFTLP